MQKCDEATGGRILHLTQDPATCGIPLAVLEGARTGTFARLAIGSALNACCERVGPTMATTLSRLIKF